MIHKIFCGKWSLSRDVTSGSGALISEMKGEVVWDQVDHNAFLYREKVSHLLKGKELKASQTYLYEISENKLRLFLADGRLYASFSLHSLINATSSFQCGKDKYQTTFLKCTETKILQRVEVLGPKKDYLIVSELRPIPVNTCTNEPDLSGFFGSIPSR